MSKAKFSKILAGTLATLTSLGLAVSWLVKAVGAASDVHQLRSWLLQPAFFLTLFAVGIGFNAWAILTSESGIRFRSWLRGLPLRSPVVFRKPWTKVRKPKAASNQQVQSLERLRERIFDFQVLFQGLRTFASVEIFEALAEEGEPRDQAVVELVRDKILAPYEMAFRAWEESVKALKPAPTADDFESFLKSFGFVLQKYDEAVYWLLRSLELCPRPQDLYGSERYQVLYETQLKNREFLVDVCRRTSLGSLRSSVPRRPWRDPSLTLPAGLPESKA